jgi:hypothetical protein
MEEHGWFPAVITLLALVAGFLLDGFTLACNEPIPPQCVGFHVAWPVLISVALATLVPVLGATFLCSGRRGSARVPVLAGRSC